jgi:serine/threonine protein kinase
MNVGRDSISSTNNNINFSGSIKEEKTPTKEKEPKKISTETMVNNAKKSMGTSQKNQAHLNKSISLPDLPPDVDVFVQNVRSNLASSSKTPSSSTAKEDRISREIKKVSSTAQNSIPTNLENLKKLAEGKAKEVYSHPDDPTKVIYKPVSAPFNAKQKEIEEEVKAGKSIESKLFEKCLLKVFASDAFKPVSQIKHKLLKADLIKALYESYPSPKDLLKAIDNESLINILQQKLPGDTAYELFKKLKDPISLQILKDAGNHLALDLREIGTENMYAVETEAAQGDVEKTIRAKSNFGDLLTLSEHFIHGMKDLQSVGSVHGDIKPENILVYGKLNETGKVVDDQGNEVTKGGRLDLKAMGIANSKSSDWGKRREIGNNEDLMYTGNPRYAPPELRLSKKGEVYSSGIILIRILEEAVLNKKSGMDNSKDIDTSADVYKTGMLIHINESTRDSTKAVQKNRRGIEKFLCLNKFTPQTEIKTFGGNCKVYGKSIVTSNKKLSMTQLQESQKQTDRYINKLAEQLTIHKHLSKEDAHELKILLKSMTQADPSKRPDMEEVHTKFQDFLAKVKAKA